MSISKERVKVIINEQGDTLVTMSYEDGKILLEDVLHYEYADSLLAAYKVRDSLNTNQIEMQKDVLMKMGQEKLNLEKIISNFELIVANKDEELRLKDDIIKQQRKEIIKQKFLKIIGFASAVILPILVLLAIG